LRVVLAKLGRSRAARTIFYFVIAGLDPAIHAEWGLAEIRRIVRVAERQHGPPGQARW
jgi:hypothetical protein